jgi:N-acetylglutamate synthase-like GNAT family acetyltransferase
MAMIAFKGKELVGTVCLKVHEIDTRPDLTPWLSGLYVSVSQRKQWIGSELVLTIEKKAQELGVKKLYLYTPESENFYYKLGWHVKERTKYNGYPVTIMQKEMGI